MKVGVANRVSDGLIKVEMHFPTQAKKARREVCHGKRFNEATLDVKFSDTLFQTF